MNFNRTLMVNDLKRLAIVFEEQATLAAKNDEHHSIEFELHFSDETTVESETLNMLEDDIVLTSKRPLSIQFSYQNYTLKQRMSLSLNHGNTSYGNTVIVSGEERAWVNDIFARLGEVLQGVTPQESFINRHPTIMLNVIALGIGTFGCFLIEIIINYVFEIIDLTKHITPPQKGSFIHSLAIAINAHRWFFYLLGWVWKWFFGFFWGAFGVRQWFLNLWPTIELDLGPEHLKIEKNKRKKVYAVLAMVVIPIATALIYDILKIFI